MRSSDMPLKKVYIAFLIGCVFCTTSYAQNVLDLETGVVIPGYNDVAIPGNTGTRFSLTEDLDAKQAVAFRLRYSRTFSERHWGAILIAPLTIRSSGTLEKDVVFNNTTFQKGSKVDASFRFDSYRVLYRYLLKQSNTWTFSIGGALKIRDAAITLQSGGLKSEKDNVGVVPLLSFNMTWEPQKRFSVLFDGEALAAPQGRAEDVLLAVQYNLRESLALKAGYRLLEGGADNDEVYTFSLFHYLVVGVLWSF